MFKPVPSKPNISQLEDSIIRFWKTWRISEKCEEQRRSGGDFVYYEEPPSPHSKPALSHTVTRVMSDIFLRYKTMRGYHIYRRSGWQAHGLPMELMVAKQLGLTGKNQIEEFGIGNFTQRCRNSLDFYAPYWERMNDHLAYWINAQDAYVTFTNEYIESVWWAFKSLWDKGVIYQSLHIMPYCPSCGVHLLETEAAQTSREVPEILACVRLPLINGPGTSMLVMTNAPWSLVGNVAVAVNPDAEYITIEQDAPGGGVEHLIVARRTAEKIFGETPIKIVDKFKGKKIKGEAYFPLYTFLLPPKPAHFVIVDDCVRDDIGTGIMHIAPTFDEQALFLTQVYDLPILNPLTDSGAFIPEVRPWSGKLYKDADIFIVRDLDARGLLYKAESRLIPQPYCLYCGSTLLNYAGNHWFVRLNPIQDKNAHLRELTIGRLGAEENINNISGSSQKLDRMLTYNRFWGTPLPVWECQLCHYQICIGSINDLSDLAGIKLLDIDLHYPSIDEIFIKCPECKGKMARITGLLHPWFEASCMPFAQWHYPIEKDPLFDKTFPADFSVAATRQTGAWQTDLDMVSSLLFGKTGIKSKIFVGDISITPEQIDADGQTESAWLLTMINEFGGDAFRLHLFESNLSPTGDKLPQNIFTEEALIEAQKVLNHLWEIYAFFIRQANASDWTPLDIPEYPAYHILDRWLRSELHSLLRDVTIAYETFDAFNVISLLKQFVEKFARWGIRHYEHRLQQQDMNEDKLAAFAALYETLEILCKVWAPVAPFLSEEIYQNLVANPESNLPISIHLCDWPISDPDAADGQLIQEMADIVQYALLGETMRKAVNIPIHQPLAEIAFFSQSLPAKERFAFFTEYLQRELNIKRVVFLETSEQVEQYLQTHKKYEVVSKEACQAILITQLTPELIDEGAAFQVIQAVKSLRDQAELGENEPIRLYVKAAPVLTESLFRNRQTMIREVVVDEMISDLPSQSAFTFQFEINGEIIIVGIEKHR